MVQTAQLGADGGLARYRLTLAAWTHWLQQRRDTRIFQDLCAKDIGPGARPIHKHASVLTSAAARCAPTPPNTARPTGPRATPDGPRGLELAPGPRRQPAHPGHFDELAEVPDVGALRFGRTDLRSANGHGRRQDHRLHGAWANKWPQCRDPGRGTSAKPAAWLPMPPP